MNQEPLIQVAARMFSALDVNFEQAEAYLFENDPLTRNGNTTYIDMKPFLERMDEKKWADKHVIAVAEILVELESRLMFKLNGNYISVGKGKPSQVLVETVLARIFLDYFDGVDFRKVAKQSGTNSKQGSEGYVIDKENLAVLREELMAYNDGKDDEAK